MKRLKPAHLFLLWLAFLVFAFVVLGVARFRNQRYETTMLVSVSYPPPSNVSVGAFRFDDAFWAKVRESPAVQDLLAIENPEDANAWLNSHFEAKPVKNSQQILSLTVHRYRYHDRGPLESYPDLLRAIADQMRAESESAGADVAVLQNAGIPIKTLPIRGMFR